MYYISKKVNDMYQVKDTESSEVFVKSYDELRVMYGKGVKIQGVSDIADHFVVIPVGLQVELKRDNLAKMKLVTGSSSGIIGLDLKVDGDRVIAKMLDKSFFDYVEKNAINDRFILKIPNIVTDIDDNFMEGVFTISGLRFYIHVELPTSLKRIGENAFNNINIWGIHLNSIVDSIGGNISNAGVAGKRIDYYLDRDENTLNVRHLCKDAICVTDREEIRLPYTKVIDTYSLNRKDYNPFVVYLGSCIESIGAVKSNGIDVYRDRSTGELISYGKSEEDLMKNANIFFLPDNSNLRHIDLTRSNSLASSDNLYCTSHVLILSDWEYERLKPIILNSKLGSDRALGILTYRSERERNFISRNTIKIFKDYKSYFSKCITLDSVGKVIMLKLKI